MKKIAFEYFGIGQYIYFDIGRFLQVEQTTKMSVGELIVKQELNLTVLTVLLSVGLRHHGFKGPQWYGDKLQELIDEGVELSELQMKVVQAVAGSGILGKEAYYRAFPEELTKRAQEKLEEEREEAEKN